MNDIIKIQTNDQLRYLEDKKNHGIIPYINIRDDMFAVFTRSCMLDLINYCDYHDSKEGEIFGFWSNKRLFPVDLIED